jgi:hypothetical protein
MLRREIVKLFQGLSTMSTINKLAQLHEVYRSSAGGSGLCGLRRLTEA